MEERCCGKTSSCSMRFTFSRVATSYPFPMCPTFSSQSPVTECLKNSYEYIGVEFGASMHFPIIFPTFSFIYFYYSILSCVFHKSSIFPVS